MMKRVTSFLLVLVLFAGFVLTAAPTVRAASEMKASDSMIAVLKQEEGFSRTPYWDYAQYTVGYGTACPSDMVDYYMENGITEEAAEVLLRNYLANTENTINKKFIDKYGLTLTQGQFDALVSFTYNCGSGWISETNGTFHNAVKNGTTGSELIRAFSLWCSAGGKILPGLVRRRLSEANMFLNEQYSRSAPDNYCYVYYNANGGSVSYKIQGYDSNLGTAPAYTPTYSGHTFQGWYTAQVGGTQVTTLTQALSGSTLYARWSSNETNTDTNTEAGSDSAAKQPITITVTGTNVNLRKGPGTNYTIVGRANVGDQFTITETASGSGYFWGNDNGTWICLQYTNYDAVIAQLEQQKQETTAPTETTEPETTAPETSETETTAPETTETETTTPETTETETTVPETTAPETTVPETTAPPATEPTSVLGTVRAVGGLALRSGPGTNYSRIRYLPNGMRVAVFEQQNVGGVVWGRLHQGWVSMSYVILDAPVPETTVPPTTAPETTVPETTAPPTTEPETTAPEATEPEATVPETAAPAPVGGTVRANGGLAIRTGPGTGYGRVRYLSNGSRVNIYEQTVVGNMTWGRMDEGWVSMSYVILDSTAPAPTVPETTVPPATTPTVYLGVGGTIKASGGLAVRNGPATSYSVSRYLRNGSRITIYEQQTVNGVSWGTIGDGWVCLNYVTLDTPVDNSATTKVVVADCLRVRNAAGTGNLVVGFVYYGSNITIYETTDVGGTTWGRCDKGWVSMDYLV